MNRKSVLDGTPPLDLTFKSEKTPFVKVHSVGDKALEKYSPIVKSITTETKPKPHPVVRQKRNPWTKEEDDRLVALIKQERCNTIAGGKEATNILYVKIAARLNSGRTAKQCRDRWQNFLRDGIKKGAWTIDEEDLIKDLYATFGAKWSVMAKLFTDRSDNDIKNKWYSMKRKDERNGTSECKNPFADMNVVPNPTVAVDYSSLYRHGIVSSFLETDDLQGDPTDRTDDTKVASTTADVQCSYNDDFTEV